SRHCRKRYACASCHEDRSYSRAASRLSRIRLNGASELCLAKIARSRRSRRGMTPTPSCALNDNAVNLLQPLRLGPLRSEGAVKMLSDIKRLWRQESGQDAAEYALLIVGIAIVVVAALYAFGHTTSNSFSGAAQTVIGGGSGGSGGGSGSGGSGGGGG